jgi:hypothetical protein
VFYDLIDIRCDNRPLSQSASLIMLFCPCIAIAISCLLLAKSLVGEEGLLF